MSLKITIDGGEVIKYINAHIAHVLGPVPEDKKAEVDTAIREVVAGTLPNHIEQIIADKIFLTIMDVVNERLQNE